MALESRAKGKEARFGPAAFPAFDYGERLIVPTPEQGGDGTAINEFQERRRSAMRGSSGTMTTREEMLRQKRLAALTTDLKTGRRSDPEPAG
jgi:hypothetical protein